VAPIFLSWKREKEGGLMIKRDTDEPGKNKVNEALARFHEGFN
jgi:hypothetical protein